MSRISPPALESVPTASQPLLESVRQQLGVVPNLYRLIAASPGALQGFLGFVGATAGAFDVRTKQRIALAVGQVNGCDYCLSAHSLLASKLAKLSDDEIQRARHGESADAKAGAATAFAARIAQTHGKVSDADLQAVRDAGYSDAQIVELVAHVAQNVFTNFLNNVAQTPIDFPVVHASELE